MAACPSQPGGTGEAPSTGDTPTGGPATGTGGSEPTGAGSTGGEPTGTGSTHGDEPTSTGDGTTETTGPDIPGFVTLRGAVQKGPFILGSSVEVAPLGPGGDPIGLQFGVTIDNDRGEFEIADIPVGLVTIVADGYHFDEVRDGLSKGTLTLRALHDAGMNAETINLHPLTHLIEARARALLGPGVTVEQALAQAQSELLAQLDIGVPGLVLADPVSQASVAGSDTLDNAYVFAVAAVFAGHAHAVSPDAPDAALQLALNTAAVDLAGDGMLTAAVREQLALAESQLDAAAVQQALDGRLMALGLPPGPDIRRALDQDFDALANIADNCPLHANPGQEDGDGDGMGDACDACPASATDQDGDGIQDACDLCPDVENAPTDEVDGPDKDKDGDGIPNACDSCWLSAQSGAVPGENCCDPRDEPIDCSEPPDINLENKLGCIPTGEQFSCGANLCLHLSVYRQPCSINCGDFKICVPGEALLPWPYCSEGVGCYCGPDEDCFTTYCTVGDASVCGGDDEDIQCVAYYPPGDAPAGLEDLGICMRANVGPCAGKYGIECVL